MRVAVTGSSGLVGSAVVAALEGQGHQVVRLVRQRPEPEGGVYWEPSLGEIHASRLEGLDAVVHLAGESVAARRWTRAQKERIRRSRVDGTRLLATTLAQLSARPAVLACASGTGYYGDRGDELVDESSSPGTGFLAEVCQQWEAAAEPARAAGIRVVHLRFGMVLSDRGGALARMLPLFRRKLGGRVGSGRQFWSWVALDDVVRVVLRALEDDRLTGPVNCVSPYPVTNRQFTRTLADVLGQPAVLPAPAWALQLLLGQMARELLLASTRCIPRRLQEAGFEFLFPDLPTALRHVVG